MGLLSTRACSTHKSLIESELDLHSIAHVIKMALGHHCGLTHLSMSVFLDKRLSKQPSTPWCNSSGLIELHGCSIGGNGPIGNNKLLAKFQITSIPCKGGTNFECKGGIDEWQDFLMVYDLEISTFANKQPGHHCATASLSIDKDGIRGFKQAFEVGNVPIVLFSCRMRPFEFNFMRPI